MKKSKLFAAGMATTLLFGVSAVSAATLNQDTTEGSTTVKYGVEGGYVITIPDTVVVSTTGTDVTVSASDVLIGENETLKVTVASANSWELQKGDSSIAYTLTKESATLANDDVVLEVESGNDTGSVTLKATATADAISAATQSGEHTDTLTFTAEVE